MMVLLPLELERISSIKSLPPTRTLKSGLKPSNTPLMEASLPSDPTTTRSTSMMLTTVTESLVSAQSTTPSLFQSTGARMETSSDQSAVPMSSSSLTVTHTTKIPTVPQTPREQTGKPATPSTDGSLMESSLQELTEPTSTVLTSLQTSHSLLPVMTTV
jgi:hypothetical protein